MAVGQAVFGQASGSLGSHVKCCRANIVAMPANVTFEAAATVPTVFMTADAAFHHAVTLHISDRVLVHAAAGQLLSDPERHTLFMILSGHSQKHQVLIIAYQLMLRYL